MISGRPLLYRSLTTMLAIAALASVLHAQNSRNPIPGAVPPHETVGGLTYGEWSARWWKWALETTAAESPLDDATGANCAVNQSGKVWFLAGMLFSGQVERTCTVPTGTRLFFPVVNAFCAAEGDFAAMRECATGFLTGVTFQVTIDGKIIDEDALTTYRALSPEFDLVLPEGNALGAPADTYAPAAADGYYVMLNPLSRGTHEVHILATFPDGSQIDVKYTLTVGR